MTKYCTECGSENLDDANFCSKCGLPFDEYDRSPFDANAPMEIPKKYNDYQIKETSFCFNCRQNSLIHLKKDSLLSGKSIYFCTNCGLTLEKSGNSFKITDLLDRNNTLWKYKGRPLKIEEWENIANGGLSNKDQINQDNRINELREQLIQIETERDIQTVMQAIIKNDINLTPVDCPADLRDNEMAYLSLPNIILSEPQISKNASFETSFKLSKGVALKSSASKTTRASYKNLNEIDSGTFILTDKRVIFLGRKKTVKFDLRKILSINIFEDGVSIVRENKKKVEYFTGTNQHTITYTINGRKLTLALEGNIIRSLILGQIANL